MLHARSSPTRRRERGIDNRYTVAPPDSFSTTVCERLASPMSMMRAPVVLQPSSPLRSLPQLAFRAQIDDRSHLPSWPCACRRRSRGEAIGRPKSPCFTSS